MAQDDADTVAAIIQSENAASGMKARLGMAESMQTLGSFYLHCSDGIEMLGMDSPQERVLWSSALW